MAHTRVRSTAPKAAGEKTLSRSGSLGLKVGNVAALVEELKAGLSFAALARFQKKSELPMPVIAKVLQIPPRTLARRRASGTLTSHESERLVRLAGLFDKAVNLFEGDVAAANSW